MSVASSGSYLVARVTVAVPGRLPVMVTVTVLLLARVVSDTVGPAVTVAPVAPATRTTSVASQLRRMSQLGSLSQVKPGGSVHVNVCATPTRFVASALTLTPTIVRIPTEPSFVPLTKSVSVPVHDRLSLTS